MQDFGQSSKFLILPIAATVSFLTAYFFYEASRSVIGEFINSNAILNINNTVNILNTNDIGPLIPNYPDITEYRKLPFLIWCNRFQIIVYIFMSVISLLGLYFTLPIMALTLYYLVVLYISVYTMTHCGIFYYFKKKEILDEMKEFRQIHVNLAFLGDIKWPDLFYYKFIFNLLRVFYMYYLISEILYSFYNILRSGGSGWEFLSANQLPGWKLLKDIENEREMMENENEEKSGLMVNENKEAIPANFSPEETKKYIIELMRNYSDNPEFLNAINDMSQDELLKLLSMSLDPV